MFANARAGDTEAWNALLTKLRPYLHLLVKRLAWPATGQKLDGSDVVQESMMRIQRGFHEFRGQTVAEFLAWIRTIVKRANKDLLSKIHAEKRTPAREVSGSGVLAILAAGSTPDQRAERAEDAVELAAALQRLHEKNPRYREAIELRIVRDLTGKQAAEEMGVTSGAFRVILHRALQELKADEALVLAIGRRSI